MLGFNGIAIQSRGQRSRDNRDHPLERIVLETDSPYSRRYPAGSKPNAPHYLPFVPSGRCQVKQLNPRSCWNRSIATASSCFRRSRLMEYMIGQRWVSRRRPVGPGVVVGWRASRRPRPSPPWRKRTYARTVRPLSRLRLKVGDRISTVDKVGLVVTAVNEQQGLLVYTGTDHHDRNNHFRAGTGCLRTADHAATSGGC